MEEQIGYSVLQSWWRLASRRERNKATAALEARAAPPHDSRIQHPGHSATFRPARSWFVLREEHCASEVSSGLISRIGQFAVEHGLDLYNCGRRIITARSLTALATWRATSAKTIPHDEDLSKFLAAVYRLVPRMSTPPYLLAKYMQAYVTLQVARDHGRDQPGQELPAAGY